MHTCKRLVTLLAIVVIGPIAMADEGPTSPRHGTAPFIPRVDEAQLAAAIPARRLTISPTKSCPLLLRVR